MAHEPAVALQQASWIRQRYAVKEPHVYVRLEYVDVAEGRISQTCNRAAVMQKLPDFVPAFSHHLKPLMRDGSQFTCVLFHPRIDGGITLDSTAESQQFRSHRRSNSFFEIYGYVTPYTRMALACRARRTEIEIFLSNAVAFTDNERLVGNLKLFRKPVRVVFTELSDGPFTIRPLAMREHSDLDQLKRQSKELLAAFLRGEPSAVEEVNAHCAEPHSTSTTLNSLIRTGKAKFHR